MIQEWLARMDRWLAAKRPNYYARLQPGASEEELNAFEFHFSLVLPTAFRLLYRWRNGQDPMCSDALQGNRLFSSLRDITETKELLDGMIGYDFEDPRYWRRGWIPFLHNGGGSHLCLDTTAEDDGTPGQLVAFWKADPDRQVEFADIEAWLEELVLSMESGS